MGRYRPDDKSVTGELGQRKTDTNILSGAVQAGALWAKIQKDGWSNVLKYYGKAHSAVKGGLGNLVNSALGDEEFAPIEAIQAGFETGKVTSKDVIAGAKERLEESLPTIHTPMGLNEAIQQYTIPGKLGLLKGAELPEEIEPEQYLKAPSLATEVVVDVLTDPLLATITPAFKGVAAVSKLSGVTNVLKSAVKATIKKLPKGLVDWTTWAFTTKGGRNKDLITILDKYYMAEQKTQRQSAEMARSLSEGLDKHKRLLLGKRIRGEVAPLEAELEIKAKQARETLDTLGAAYAKEGFIAEETFFKNVGKYFPRMYASKEVYVSLAKKYGINAAKVPHIVGHRGMKRKNIPVEIREAMGEILEPAYPIGRAMQQIQHDLNVQNVFKSLLKQPGWVSDTAGKGFSLVGSKTAKLRSGERWGILNGKFIRDDVLRDIKTMADVPGKLKRIYLKTLSTYKLMKVLPNPSTHVRNLFSAGVMSNLSPTGDKGLHHIFKMLDEAGGELLTKGKYLDEVVDAGAWHTDFFKQELERGLYAMEDITDFISLPHDNIINKFKKAGMKGAQEAYRALGKLYSGEDNLFKMAHYMHARKHMGMNVPEAVEYMRKWGFDYSRVSPAVQFLRNYTTPFVTFQAKALPRIGEVILKNPARFYKWPVIFDAISRMSARVHNMDEEQMQQMQESTRGVPILLPWSDSEGNPLSLDATYMVPWGDMQETGGALGLPPGLTISNPFAMLPAQLIFNKNIFMDQPIMTDIAPDGKRRLSVENLQKGFEFIYRSAMPALAPPIPYLTKGGYSFEKIQKGVSPIPEHRKSPSGLPYDLNRVVLDVLLGLKTRGVKVDQQIIYGNAKIKRWLQARRKRMFKISRNQSLTAAEKQKKLETETNIIKKTLEKELRKHAPK